MSSFYQRQLEAEARHRGGALFPSGFLGRLKDAAIEAGTDYAKGKIKNGADHLLGRADSAWQKFEHDHKGLFEGADKMKQMAEAYHEHLMNGGSLEQWRALTSKDNKEGRKLIKAKQKELEGKLGHKVSFWDAARAIYDADPNTTGSRFKGSAKGKQPEGLTGFTDFLEKNQKKGTAYNGLTGKAKMEALGKAYRESEGKPPKKPKGGPREPNLWIIYRTAVNQLHREEFPKAPLPTIKETALEYGKIKESKRAVAHISALVDDIKNTEIRKKLQEEIALYGSGFFLS